MYYITGILYYIMLSLYYIMLFYIILYYIILYYIILYYIILYYIILYYIILYYILSSLSLSLSFSFHPLSLHLYQLLGEGNHGIKKLEATYKVFESFCYARRVSCTEVQPGGMRAMALVVSFQF